MAIRAGKRPGDAIDQSPQEKKMRASINDAAADLLCPISQELPVDPVIAEWARIFLARPFSKANGAWQRILSEHGFG